MNTFMLPRPSLRGAVLWQRTHGAVAFTPSAAFAVVFPGLVLMLCLLGMSYEPLTSFLMGHWLLIAIAILAVNVAATTWTSIGTSGVRVRRLAVAFLPSTPAPLRGTFRRSLASAPGEPDRDREYDEEDFELGRLPTQWVYYEHVGGVVSIDCLRPKATAEWLNEQLARVLLAQSELPPATMRRPKEQR